MADFYISDAFAKAHGLQPAETGAISRSWKNAGTMKLTDSRWVFSSVAEAKQYLQLNLPVLSETGDPVKADAGISNVSSLYMYDEGAGNRSLNEATGKKAYAYIFLFTVKNYLAKVKVSAGKKMELSGAALYAREAAKRLNAAIKN